MHMTSTEKMSKMKIQVVTPVVSTTTQPPSYVPTGKKQRIAAEDVVESDIIGLLSDTSFLSALDDVLVGKSGDSCQTAISPVPIKRKKKNKAKIKRKQNTASARVFGIKQVAINIVRYLEIKTIILIRRINQFLVICYILNLFVMILMYILNIQINY